MKANSKAPLVLFLLASCASPREAGAPPGTVTPAAPGRVAAPGVAAVLPTPVRTAAAPANRRVIVRAARMLDVRAGRIVTDQAIAIQGDKIVRIAPSAQVVAAPGTDVIEIKNEVVLPGLIDMHVHLTGEPKQAGLEHLTLSLPRETLVGAKNALITINAGFTTVRNVGAGGYSDVALRDAINEGDLDGPRIVAAGLPLGITGGHCDETMLPFDTRSSLPSGVADGVAEVQKKVREQIKFGADVIKVCATGWVLSKGDDPRTSQ